MYAGWQTEEESYEEGGWCQREASGVQIGAELGGDPGPHNCPSTLPSWFFLVSCAELLPSRTRDWLPRLHKFGFPLIGYVTLDMLLHLSVFTFSTLGPLRG